MHPPSVDTLARSRADSPLPHPLLVDAARAAIAAGRHEDFDEFVRRAERRLLVPVINATGVLLHTNMGRAPVAMHRSSGYSNLELDLEDGKRGSRQARVASLLARAGGAEAAVVRRYEADGWRILARNWRAPRDFGGGELDLGGTVLVETNVERRDRRVRLCGALLAEQ